MVLLNLLSIFLTESSLRLINDPNLTNSLQSLSHRRLVADLSIFYCYFHGHCSQEIKNIIPDPVRRVRTTKSSTHSHPFQVTLPNPRALAHKSSFLPRTSQLWSSLPPTTFPESYNLSSFKSNVNKLDLVSLSTYSFPIFSVLPLSGLCYRPYGLSLTLCTKKTKKEVLLQSCFVLTCHSHKISVPMTDT